MTIKPMTAFSHPRSEPNPLSLSWLHCKGFLHLVMMSGGTKGNILPCMGTMCSVQHQDGHVCHISAALQPSQ